MSNEVGEYIDHLRQIVGVKSDSELAIALGKAKQTVSSWRRRGVVPLDVQYALADIYGPQAALLSEVREATTAREKQAILAVFLSLYDQYRHELNPSDDRERYVSWAQAFFFCEHDIREAIRELGFVDPGDDQYTTAEMIRAMIDTGKLPAVKRSIDVWIRQLPVDE